MATITEIRAPGCNGIHSLAAISGYAVVRTRFGIGGIEEAASFDGASSYGAALDCAHAERAAADGETHDYARIDVLYADGCRGIL